MSESLKLFRICNIGFRQHSCKYIFLLCFIGLWSNLVLGVMSIWRPARVKYEAEKQCHSWNKSRLTPVIDWACNKTCGMIKYFRFVFIMYCGAQHWRRVSLHTLSGLGPPCHRRAVCAQRLIMGATRAEINYGCYSRASTRAGKGFSRLSQCKSGPTG